MSEEEEKDEIHFKLPKPAAIWFEKLSRKGPSLPENKTLSGYESVAVSPSGRLVFFHFRDQLMVVDTWCGAPTKLRSLASAADRDPLVSFQFLPIDDKEGVMFRKSCVASHCGNQYGLEAAKFKMDFRAGRLLQSGNWLKVVKLYALYEITQLKHSVLIYGQIVKDRTFGGGGNWVEYLREFDLEKMELKQEAICFKDSRLHNVGYSSFVGKWEGKYYSFFRRRLKSFPTLSREFGQITQVDAKTGKVELLQLENDPSCAYTDNERRHLLYLDGSWHSQYFYLHSCFATAPHNNDRPQYEHFFARLDLKGLRWIPVKFGQESSLQTRLPLKMTVTRDDQLLLVKSGNGRTIQMDDNPKMDPLLVDRFCMSGGHVHCAVYRLALRCPEPLKNLCLYTLNRLNPSWKVQKHYLQMPQFPFRPIAIVDPRQCRPTNNFPTKRHDLKCPECYLHSTFPSLSTALFPLHSIKNPRRLIQTFLQKHHFEGFVRAFVPLFLISLVFYVFFKVFVRYEGVF